MEEIKQFFNDIHKIAEFLESKNRGDENTNDRAEMPIPVPINQPQNSVPIMATMETPVAKDLNGVHNVPVLTNVETFTRDEIAVAMSQAMQMGKHALVQNILKTFNANSLMEIEKSNYGQIAIMLREAGIKI